MKNAFAGVDAVLSDATVTPFTGAVARIEYRGAVVFERAYGTTRDDTLALPVAVDTRFASITKLFVATMALQAVADGAVELDAPLVEIIPEWYGTAHASITLRMLLAHTSGMNSGADYRQLLGDNVERFALTRDLVATPGEKVIYSDLGFIALGALVARIRGCSLATVTKRTFPSTTFGYGVHAAERLWVPATERDSWRGRVQGLVHDEKAYLMGGVAGHAGLFGAASDVARLAETYLGPLCGRAGTVLPQSLVVAATEEAAYDPVLRRGLGWALKTTDTNSCGATFSMQSFGHTGFVGTCVWADPQRDLQAVLLTNTVYFGRHDTRDLRAAFYDAAVEALR